MQIPFTFKTTVLFVMGFVLIFSLQVFIAFKLVDKLDLLVVAKC